MTKLPRCVAGAVACQLVAAMLLRNLHRLLDSKTWRRLSACSAGIHAGILADASFTAMLPYVAANPGLGDVWAHLSGGLPSQLRSLA